MDYCEPILLITFSIWGFRSNAVQTALPKLNPARWRQSGCTVPKPRWIGSAIPVLAHASTSELNEYRRPISCWLIPVPKYVSHDGIGLIELPPPHLGWLQLAVEHNQWAAAKSAEGLSAHRWLTRRPNNRRLAPHIGQKRVLLPTC